MPQTNSVVDILECMETPQQTEKGELTATFTAPAPSSTHNAIQFIHPVGGPTVDRRGDVRLVTTY
jgi:hypothetical protein